MKKLSFPVIVIMLFFSCISEQENYSIRLEQDKEAIQEYLAENPIDHVHKFEDVNNGVYIFWEEKMGGEYEFVLGDTLFIDYTGKLLTNRVFDTSLESVARENSIFNSQRTYKPLEFVVGRDGLIDGFLFALSKMQQGDKVVTLFPSLFGYGNQASGSIPPNSPLIFEIHLVKVGQVKKDD
ncbi:FKBP-type peptidyl-prolyl cis-trans isomerase [Belliella kenyensis]|uniref:Peptidyl-prolyl cis-trans isomerase n=1 Tax=Belliella kenyensis TaxID=1472724 RepID=A0ABV8EJ03_9BACT|nr:FKBP-type peptidyl-prolyl cis-trans isomerase [Belliella kenyensis]MCH7403699.1 FKBP-type peptidyl-prolyl cis-trans isomerase [Belliella kenyensis]MDN3603466.1 FKBP-type peptidyl-prolyl cis-trans isomerase [Belliella kenyensis]